VGNQPPEFESRIEELSRRLAAVERRLSHLEVLGPAGRAAAASAPAVGSEIAGRKAVALDGFSSALLGRTFLVLAGAFGLRALTESGLFPQGIGTALGFAYAILWIVRADRAGAAGQRMSATLHGVAAAVIGFPLLWESTVRFGILSAEMGAAALTAFTAIALAVAQRQRLRRLALVFTIGAAVTALGLAVATKMLILFAAFLLLLGFATMWMDYLSRWSGPGLLSAIVIDGFVLLMTVMVLMGDSEQVIRIFNPAFLVTLQLALVLLYVGSFGIRTLTKGRDLHASEITHGVAVLLIGLGGAVLVTRAAGLSGIGFGLVSLLLGAGCYGISFAVLDRHLGSRVNFIFYTTLALAFTGVAIGELLGDPLRSMAFSASALVVVWLGARRDRATLSMHGAVYVVAAAITSGLALHSVAALVAPVVADPGWITPAALVALAVAAGCAGFPVASHGRTWGRLSHGPRLVWLSVAAIGAGGVVISLLATLLPRTAESTVEPGAQAAMRTCVIATSAVLLALIGRWPRCAEASWLVYPVLVTGGLKLLAEDARAGRASTLVVSLAFYGGALIVAPWIVRRGAKGAPGGAPGATGS